MFIVSFNSKRYRKYHLFGEAGVQQTEKPDQITFKTDFNVTFGVCICFDLFFDEPVLNLVQQGVKHIIFPTKWFSELPYLSGSIGFTSVLCEKIFQWFFFFILAVQYQQSWAYANNVNLLAANINLPDERCSGSGIYSGRSGALQVVVSETPATTILVAKVPIHLPDEEPSIKSMDVKDTPINGHKNIKLVEQPVAIALSKENLTQFSVNFLDFASNPSQVGSVCNKAICCKYIIEVSDNGEQDGKVSISVLMNYL